MFGTILIFLAILIVLVLVHEFGHFFTAKKTGMVVEEFGIGFPPRATSKVISGTRYSLNWLPFGGFVKIKGENPEDPGANEEGSFAKKTKLQRLLVLSSGVLMNLLLAWVLISISLLLGSPQALENGAMANQSVSNERLYITDVSSGSPASDAGIQSGDIIVSINNTNINSIEDIHKVTSENAGKNIEVVLDRKGEILSFSVFSRDNVPEGQGSIGVSLVEIADVSYSPFQSIVKGFTKTYDYLKLTVSGFAQILKKLFVGSEMSVDVAGPIGIAVLTSQFAQMGFSSLLQFAAILSINLAVINILPIPALDGGRILFVLIEAIRGKKVSSKIEQMTHGIGFAFLLLLMAVVLIRDFVKLF